MNTQAQDFQYLELNAFITNQLPTGTAFGYDYDQQEQVFIPSHLARQYNIVPGDTVRIRAMPNRKEGGARWFAIYIDRETDVPAHEPVRLEPVKPAVAEVPPAPVELEPEEDVDWFAECLLALKEMGGAATTSQIASFVDWPTANIGTYMRVLHERGKVARAGIRTSGTQSKDSHVFWALNTHDLFPTTSDNG